MDLLQIQTQKKGIKNMFFFKNSFFKASVIPKDMFD